MIRFVGDVWRTAIDEWRAVWYDEGVVLIVVFALFIYSAAYSLGYGGEVLNEVPVAVVNDGGGALSYNLIRKIDASPKIDITHEVGNLYDAEQLFRERKVYGVVALSPTFDEDILSARQGRVAILGDASYFLFYREVVEGAVAAIGAANRDIIAEREGRYTPPILFEQRNLFNAELGYGVFVMPAIILLIVQQTALIGIGMLSATRRERGVRLSAQSPLAITIGRTLTYLAIYGTTLGFMLTIHYSLFGYPMHGAWWRCLIVVLLYLLAVTFMAQSLGALFRRRESSIVWLLWTSIPLLLVSGVSLPPQAFPRWLYIAGRVVPSSSAVDAWIAIQTRGASLSDIAPELTLLCLLVAFYALLAMVANRRVSNSYFLDS